MALYVISQFDTETFQVIDKFANREICVCGNYLASPDAEKRARQIANALNRKTNHKTTTRRQGHRE